MILNPIVSQLLLQAFLILLNAFFAATEIAVISLNPTKLRRLKEEGDKSANRLLKLVEEPAGFLSTIQVGITLAGFLGSAFAADAFSDYLVNWLQNTVGITALSTAALDTISVILITIILSYFTLILGELVPKRIAMQKPMELARFSCGVISVLATVMRPVIWFLSISTNGVLRLLRLKTQAEEETVTEEEILMMMDLGEEKGTIEHSEKEWIENVFEFGDTAVHEAMKRASDVVAVSFRQDQESIVALIRNTGLSRYPVYDKNLNDVLGILNARDFLLNLQLEEPKPLVELLRPAYFVPETMRAAQLFQDMQKTKQHIAVVIDEYGELSGIVTMEDLVEEIVGNIYDEFDPSERPEMEQLEENLWRISGSVPVEDLAETLEIDLPEDAEYDTLGGMVFSCLHTIPKDGTPLDVEVCGLQIHVDAIRHRRIEEAMVSKII